MVLSPTELTAIGFINGWYGFYQIRVEVPGGKEGSQKFAGERILGAGMRLEKGQKSWLVSDRGLQGGCTKGPGWRGKIFLFLRGMSERETGTTKKAKGLRLA